MDQKFLLAAASAHLRSEPRHAKLLSQKHLFPIGDSIGFLTADADIQVKFRDSGGGLIIADDATIEHIGDAFCLKMGKAQFDAAALRLQRSDYVFVVAEGSSQRAAVILCFFSSATAPFENLDQEQPALRLSAFDLPPSEVTIVDAPPVKAALYTSLAKSDAQLFSLGAQTFLRSPHILTHLFSHVMSLESSDHVSYISTLKVVADQLRSLLARRIRRVEKNHQELWSAFYGESISFLDGGVSRIVSLPGTEPMGIRVGIYTVTPGERDLEKRESWNLRSYVLGDVISDKSLITEQTYQTDTKRLQEAARYILEPLSALLHIEAAKEKPRLLLLHGPLQNAFAIYDELDPSFIPGVNKDFLASVGIRQEDIIAAVSDLPKDARGRPVWNGCIAVYLFIMKRLHALSVPLAGVIERGGATVFARAVLRSLVDEGTIPPSTTKKINDRISRYEIGDELLFGCLLGEGEYLEPLPVPKNFKHRAHDRWQPVVAQFPTPIATMIKCAATSFPYRVEMTSAPNPDDLQRLMSLLYHMSRLLPHYSFPVGIDIADKYAKIPDWLSKGISARLTANVLTKVLETGDARLLMQVRRLLALSPRDFFFRPKA